PDYPPHLPPLDSPPPPTDPPTPAAVEKITGGEDDDVVEVPDSATAEGEAHQDAALHPTGVEAVQAEHAAHHREPQRHAARTLGHVGLGPRRLPRIVTQRRAGGHVTRGRPRPRARRAAGGTG